MKSLSDYKLRIAAYDGKVAGKAHDYARGGFVDNFKFL
jgi:hypothetical protein